MNYGIRVKNPLPKPVRVEVLDGEVIMGWALIGYAVLDPGATKFIPLDQPGSYEIRTTILNPDGTGSYDELGEAAWTKVEHQNVEEPEMRPISLARTVLIDKDLRGNPWRNVVRWDVAKGSIGELLAVEIKQTEGVTWRLKAGQQVIDLTGPLDAPGIKLTGGQAVVLQAKVANPPVEVGGRISGRETIIDGHLTPVKTQPVVEEEERPVKSLAEMMEEFRKREAALV